MGMILELPDKYRQVLYLYYYNEMSYAQIADQLDMTEVNARQVARRARKILEERLSVGEPGSCSCGIRSLAHS